MKPRMTLDEAMALKDRMPKGMFRNVDGQTADTIWLCAIEAAETHHGIRESPSKVVREFEARRRWKFWLLCAAIAAVAVGARFLVCSAAFPASQTLTCMFTIR